MPPIPSFPRLVQYRILSSYWLAHFYLMKKSTKVLHYFDLDCGMLKFFKYTTHEPESKEQLLTLPHFWRPVWQNCGVAHALSRLSKKVGGLEVFCMKPITTLNYFQIFKIKI